MSLIVTCQIFTQMDYMIQINKTICMKLENYFICAHANCLQCFQQCVIVLKLENYFIRAHANCLQCVIPSCVTSPLHITVGQASRRFGKVGGWGGG